MSQCGLEEQRYYGRTDKHKDQGVKRVPINSWLREALLWQKLESVVDDYVFVKRRGKPYKDVTYVNESARDRAEIRVSCSTT